MGGYHGMNACTWIAMLALHNTDSYAFVRTWVDAVQPLHAVRGTFVQHIQPTCDAYAWIRRDGSECNTYDTAGCGIFE
jgi:hypothetical protein